MVALLIMVRIVDCFALLQREQSSSFSSCLCAGIRGNENRKVEIRDVTLRDLEVAVVSLNNVESLIIQGCHVQGNRHDVPVNGVLSAARFIR